MARSLRALPLALALFLSSVGIAPAADHRDDGRLTLPFTRAQCSVLIARGAPFLLGGPDTSEACIIIIGGAPTR